MSQRDREGRDCTHWRELLALRIDRELDPDDEEKLRAHLESCLACQGVASWIGDVDGLAAMSTPEEPSPQALRQIEDQIMESVRRVAHRPRRSAWQTVWIPSTAVAAVVALLTWMQSERSSTVLEPPEPAGLEQARPATPVGQTKDRDEPAAGLASEAKALAEGESADETTAEKNVMGGRPAEAASPERADEEQPLTDALEKRQLAEFRPEAETDAPSAAKAEPAPASLQRRDYAVDTVGEAVGRQSGVVRRQRDVHAPSPPSLREQLELARNEPTDANVRLLLNLYAQQAVPEDADDRAPEGALMNMASTALSDSVRVFLLERQEATEDEELRSEIQEALRE